MTGVEGGVPILYSFRRCPYAMRARMALLQAGLSVDLREVVLRNKPPALLEASPKGTVPVLVLTDGAVIDESLAIMRWALSQNDPEGWLAQAEEADQHGWVALNDGPFKQALDTYKYPERYPYQPKSMHRARGEEALISVLESRLNAHPFLLGRNPRLADAAIFPFVRQWAAVDADWFETSRWSGVRRWLLYWKSSAIFLRAMHKYPVWQIGPTGD